MKTDDLSGKLVTTVIILLALCSLSFILLFMLRTEKINIPEDEITIVVTDSGLGGLSVVADLERKLPPARIFKKVNLAFFNALFSNKGGYNSLDSHDKKVRIFNESLYAMEKRYKPDMILIACNTLSVIYEDTDFAKNSKTPVTGIIDAGVELIENQLNKTPDAKVIIFATRTTVDVGRHRKELIQRGILPDRIITQKCHKLAGSIDRGFDSNETSQLVAGFVDEALVKLPSLDSPICVSFNCTHYGYIEPLWRKTFEQRNVKPIAFLNPNYVMTDLFFRPEKINRVEKTELAIEIVSMVEISQNKKDSFSRLMKSLCPQTVEALLNYQHKEDLFQWR